MFRTHLRFAFLAGFVGVLSFAVTAGRAQDEKPEDGFKDLIKIEAAEGLASILGLRNVKKWSDHPPFQKEAVENVEKLVDRITEAIEKHLGDPDRMQKFIK